MIEDQRAERIRVPCVIGLMQKWGNDLSLKLSLQFYDRHMSFFQYFHFYFFQRRTSAEALAGHGDRMLSDALGLDGESNSHALSIHVPENISYKWNDIVSVYMHMTDCKTELFC